MYIIDCAWYASVNIISSISYGIINSADILGNISRAVINASVYSICYFIYWIIDFLIVFSFFNLLELKSYIES